MRLRLFRAALFAYALATSSTAYAGRGAARPLQPTMDTDGNIIDRPSSAEVVIDLYPATDSVFPIGSQKLYWHASDHAKSYRIQLSSEGEFKNNVIDRTTSDLSVVTGTLKPGRYYWRVQSIDRFAVASHWSTTSDFEIRAGAENGTKATLHWRPPTWGSSRFVVKVARDAKMTSIVQEKATENAFFVTEALPKGRFWWRVETLDEDGKHLDWTPIDSFTISDGSIVTYQGGP